MPDKRPLVIIGIDGCTPALVESWTEAGELPVLSSLMARGCYTVLRSTPNFQSASAWTSLVTGVNPGKHGIFHFMNPQPDSYELVQIDASFRRTPSVWRLLSEAGARVAALNFPVSYPAETVHGVQVAGWLAPTAASPGFTYPPELAERITSEFGPYPIQPDVRRHVNTGRYEDGIRSALAGIRYKAQVARWLLGERPWDLFGVVFVESDSIQHWYWKLHDPCHPDHDPRLAARHGDPILRIYRALDSEIGQILETAGDEANVLVVSDHGQAANPGGQVYLRGWLRAAGLLVARGQAGGPLARVQGGLGRSLRAVMGSGLELLKERAPNPLKVRLAQRFPGLRARAQAGMRCIVPDWSRTRAWTDTGHVFINVRGVRPQGIVEPGAEYEQLVADIARELSSLVETSSGEKPVREVVRGDRVLHGEHAACMPDLLVRWRNDVPVRGLTWNRPDGRSVRLPAPRDVQLPSGAHHPDGVVLGAGPDFRSGARTAPRSIYDITPTVLHLLGQPVPSYCDGQVATEMLREQAALGVQVREMTPEDAARPGEARQSDDGGVVVARLRALGYLE